VEKGKPQKYKDLFFLTIKKKTPKNMKQEKRC
jgi:hypothetical protein